METMLNYLNLTYSRFSSVDGNKMLSNENYLSVYKHANLIVTNNSYLQKNVQQKWAAQVGCWLSYLMLLKEIAESNTTKATIMLEDDVDLDVDFYEKVNSSLVDMPADWDVLLCGHCCLSISRTINRVYAITNHATTHCQVIRDSRSAQKLFQHLNVPLLNDPVDLFQSKLNVQHLVKFYALVTPVSVQRRELFGTDIPSSGILAQQNVQRSLIGFLNDLAAAKK
jgi:GR25 family glycosyltransferase involved in LPS biosynthesis